MSDETLQAIVTALSAITVAGIGVIGTFLGLQQSRIKRIDRNARQANEQVSNDHVYLNDDGTPILDRLGNPIPINFRVDSDAKHEENRTELQDFKQEVRGAINALTNTVNNGFASINIIVEQQYDKFEELEKTIPKAELQGKGKHRV